MVLRQLGFDCFFRGPVASIAAQHPETESDDSSEGDQERQAHPQPSGHPFAEEEIHELNYR